MEKNNSLWRRLMILSLILGCWLALPAQTIFQDAMHLNTLRKHYAAFCQSLCHQDTAFSDDQRWDLMIGKSLVIPAQDGPVRTEIKAMLNARNGANSASGTALTAAAKEAQVQKVAREWALMEEYLRLTQDSLHLDTDQLDALAAVGEGFNYLDDISNHVAGQASLNNPARTGFFTSNLASQPTEPRTLPSAATPTSPVGINETAIIMGVVDWSIKQAKQELMTAFMGEWMDKLENDSILMILFPSTLNMLRTSDITTVFSNGDVWKAAFQKDLDAAPYKIPEIVQILLSKLPATALSPNERKEILGCTRLATDLFQNIGKGNTLQDALVALSSKRMLMPESQLSILDKGVVMSEALLQGLTVIDENDKAVFVKPETIARLNESQLQDLWNVMYLALQPELDKVFAGSEVDSIYHAVTQRIPMFKNALVQLTDDIQSIQQISDLAQEASQNGNTKGLNLQEVDRYFQLSLQLVDRSVGILDSLHILPAKDLALYKDKARPIALDVMTGIRGVETQQYGQLVSSLIDIVERLNLKGSKLAAAVAEGVSLFKTLKADAAELVYSGDIEGDIAKIKQALINYQKQQASTLASENIATDFRTALAATIAELSKANYDPYRTQDARQKFVSKLIHDLDQELEKLLTDVNDQLGSTPLGHAINTYGRFIVNMLTAKTSDDVETILNEFTSGVGGYMVKQTSKAALTLSLFPGVGGGAFVPLGSTGSLTTGVYGGASLPIGIELSLGIPDNKILGAVGFYAQVADLGAVLSYRITNADTTTPKLSYQQMLSPGLSVLFHGTKIPVVLGIGAAFAPPLSAIAPDGTPQTRNAAIHLGATLSVDVTAFQIWASNKKINPGYGSMGD